MKEIKNKVAVSYVSSELLKQAQRWAAQLKLPLVNLQDRNYDLLLVQTAEHLELRCLHEPQWDPVYVDFLSGALQHRLQFSGNRNELLIKAVGLKKQPGLQILDLTAGLGRDAFMMANYSAQVIMLERSSIIAALLEDGLARSRCKRGEFLSLNLCNVDALDYLNKLIPENYPDVIYYDPMFPQRAKTALPQKEMRLLRQIVGHDLDICSVLNVAFTKAKKRVVLKRPRKAAMLAVRTPDLEFSGRSSRFDVWLM